MWEEGWVCGVQLYIEGIGIVTVNDLMNKRFENRVDLFLGHIDDAWEFGIKKKTAKLYID